MGDLNNKQKLFVKEYLIDLNATKAYMRVYECSYETALTNGTALLGNARIKDLISKNLSKTFADLEITKERILREYSKIAFSDISDVLEWSESRIALKPSEGLPAAVSGSISEMTIKTERLEDERIMDTFKVKLHDKLRALDALSKYSKLVEEEGKGEAESNKSFTLSYAKGDLRDV